MEFSSNAKGNLGVTLGAIGSGLALMNGGLGIFGQKTEGQQFVTKDELNYVQTISAKDSEIAILKSENFTNEKIADVYSRLKADLNAYEKEQMAINSAQAVYNATSNSAIAVLQNQVGVLNGLTKTVVPIDSVCPLPMQRYNSWTTPTTTTTGSN